MTNIEERLQKDLIEAMKEKNTPKVNAIRSVKTAIQAVKTSEQHHEPTEDEIVKIIQKQVKQRYESEQIYLQATTPRYDLAEKEHLECVALEEYLPKMLTNEELTKVIDDIITTLEAKTMKDMGKVMSELAKKYPNQYDGKDASTIIKTRLT